MYQRARFHVQRQVPLVRLFLDNPYIAAVISPRKDSTTMTSSAKKTKSYLRPILHGAVICWTERCVLSWALEDVGPERLLHRFTSNADEAEWSKVLDDGVWVPQVYGHNCCSAPILGASLRFMIALEQAVHRASDNALQRPGEHHLVPERNNLRSSQSASCLLKSMPAFFAS